MKAFISRHHQDRVILTRFDRHPLWQRIDWTLIILTLIVIALAGYGLFSAVLVAINAY